MANDNLRQAKAAKNDEFYTQYGDIAAELKHYSAFLHGKTVLCNCDDPTWSNFWKYLHNNFSVLGLKKLISTHYEPDGSPSYKMEYEGGDDLNTEVGTVTPLKGNGDFRSEECIELLRSSDVVITNPPFSLWIPYIQTIIEAGKSFIVIGNINAAHNKDTFPLILKNKMWLGNGFRNGNAYFAVPEDADVSQYAAGVYNPDTKLVHFRNCTWYTNIDIKKRHIPFFPPEDAHCYYEGNEDKYPKIFNTDYDIIEVNKTDMIPIDWNGLMSVPVSYLDKHNAQDFSIVGYSGDRKFAKRMQELASKGSYTQGGPSFYIVDPTNTARYKRLFSRIVIKNLHPVSRKDDI